MHKRLAILGLLASVAFVGPAIGQSTSPAGYLQKPGDGYGYFLGAFGQGRFMHGDGAVTGAKIDLLRADFRIDKDRIYDAATGMGRSWTRVTLALSHTAVSKWSKSWTSNVIGASTVVFDGKASWPTITSSIAAPWGHAAFAFKQKWTYDGKQDLCFDFSFDGGALVNKASWGSVFRPYYLDSVVSDDQTDEVGFRYLPRSPFTGNNCNDSAITDTVGAYALHNVRVFGDSHPTVSLRGKGILWASTYRTAPNAPVIATICFGGSTTGAKVGAGCNSLYADTRLVVATVTATTQKTATAWSGYVFPITPRNYFATWMPGISTWFQAGWTDSKSKRFSLTMATTLTLPAKPTRYRKRSLYRGGAPAKTGFVTSDTAWWSHLHPRFSQK